MSSTSVTREESSEPADAPEFFISQRRDLRRNRQFIEWIKEDFFSFYEKVESIIDPNSKTMAADILPMLLEQLQNGDTAQRQIGLQLLYQCRSHGDTPYFQNLPDELLENLFSVVKACLHDPDLAVNREAVRALSAFPSNWRVRVLNALAAEGVVHPDAETAKCSINLLRSIEINLRSAAVPSLISALDHADEGVRQAACDVLRELGEDSLTAGPKLLSIAMSDPANKARFAAISGLVEIQGYAQTVKELSEQVTDQQNFLECLRVGGEPFRELRLSLQKGWLGAKNAPDSDASISEAGPPRSKDEEILAAIDKPGTKTRRNLQFLGLSVRYGLTPAKIRDRWRTEYPSDGLADGQGGIDVVKQGIRTAYKFLDKEKLELDDALRVIETS